MWLLLWPVVQLNIFCFLRSDGVLEHPEHPPGYAHACSVDSVSTSDVEVYCLEVIENFTLICSYINHGSINLP